MILSLGLLRTIKLSTWSNDVKKVLLIFMVVGCTGSHSIIRSTMKECSTKEEKKELADFVIKCNESANPKSDEEGEDLVIQCERTGRNILCPTIQVCREVTDPGGFMSTKIYGDYGPCEGK